MPMPTPWTGGCACGAIRYECAAAPFLALNCHCRDCQRASGSAYIAALVVPASAFTLRKGAPTYYAVTAESGHTTRRGFCPACGSPLVLKIDEFPALVSLRPASLDDPSWYRPTL